MGQCMRCVDRAQSLSGLICEALSETTAGYHTTVDGSVEVLTGGLTSDTPPPPPPPAGNMSSSGSGPPAWGGGRTHWCRRS